MSIASATPVTVAAALTAGLLWVLGTGIKTLTAKRLALTDVQAACLSAALGIAALVMLPVAGLLTDAIKAWPVLCTGSLLAALATGLLARTATFAGAVIGALLLGNASACLYTSCTVLMPGAFAGSTPGAALNLGYAVLGLGMLLAPWLSETLTTQLGLRRGLGVLALVCLLPALLAAFTDAEAFPALNGNGDGTAVLFRPEFWLLATAFFFYLPVEQALGTWAGRYLAEVGQSERRAALLLTGFWVVFLAGRLAAAFAWEGGWLRPAAGPWLVLGLALTASVFLGNLAGAGGRRGLTGGLLTVGLLLGPIFPVLCAVLFERFAPGTWGVAFGGAVAVGWLGAHLVQPLFGFLARRAGTRQALWGVVVGTLLLGLVTLVLGIARNLRT